MGKDRLDEVEDGPTPVYGLTAGLQVLARLIARAHRTKSETDKAHDSSHDRELDTPED